MEINKDKLFYLENLYLKSQNSTTIVFLKGEKGLGKSYVIDTFIKNKNNVINICPDNTIISFLSSFKSAIEIFSGKTNVINYNEVGMQYNESVANLLLDEFSDNINILVIKHINSCSCEFIDFLYDICTSLYKNIEKNAFIVIEYDTNHENNVNQNNINTLFSIDPLTEFINFKRFSLNQIKERFFDIFNNRIEICENTLNYICQSASGNLSILNIIINYLRQEDIIYRDDSSGWKCDSVSMSGITNILANYIETRYKRLDEYLKRTLQQSSMLGKKINVDDLKDTFSLLQAEEWLSNIEKITHLIYKSDEKSIKPPFVFETDEVFNYVKNQIPAESRKIWFINLSKHYKSLYEQTEKNLIYDSETVCQLIELSYHAANCYTQTGDNNKALFYYFKSIFHCMSISNFSQCRIIIDKIRKNIPDILTNRRVNLQVCRIEAILYEYTGLYEKAREKYYYCINNYTDLLFDDIYELKYKYCYCTYYSSLVYKSFISTKELSEQMSQEKKTSHKVYSDTLSLLATLYREAGKEIDTKNLYIKAEKNCKENYHFEQYNILLRKSDICLSIEQSIPRIKESLDYFIKRNNLKEAAKASQNLGCDFLFECRWDEAYNSLIYSKDIFNSFGSIDVLYAYNALGIYEAVRNKNYQKALEYFERADYNDMNAFKKLTIWLNIAICCYKLGDSKRAELIVKKCEDMPHRQINEEYPYYSRTLYIIKAFIYKMSDQLEESLKWFEKCTEIKLKPNQLYVVAKCIVDISETLGYKVDQKYIEISMLSHDSAMDICINNNVFFHCLRFLE